MISVQVDAAPAVAGETKPRRNPLIGATADLITVHDASVRTLYDNFASAVQKFGDCECLGTRKVVITEVDGQRTQEAGEYVFETYNRIAERVRHVAAGLSALRLAPNAKVGLYSINRAEWIIGEQACYANNFVTVPLYDTLGEEAIVHIILQTEMEVVIASADKLPLLAVLKNQIPSLRLVILMSDTKPVGSAFELRLFGELESAGAQMADFKPSPPSAGDLCTICYTSGTTGLPKGAMLSHKAVLAASSAALALIGHNPLAPCSAPLCHLNSPGEVYLSFLPLAHVMERVVFNTLLTVGFKIGFYQGDILKLLGDCETLKPTFFVSVPRLFNRIHDKVKAGAEAKGGLAQWLFGKALTTKLGNLHRSGQFQHWLWDRIVFNTIKMKLGGGVKAMLTGSAPLSPQILDFLRVVFACEVFEGYGMTETCAVISIASAGDLVAGNVGSPIPSIEVKLVDIPEMGYTSRDQPNPRGEIWARGANLFDGYYKDPTNTAATLKDGWVVTGDVGMFDAEGRLFIIDRKKALFKLAQGEYVAPEKIEAVLCHSSTIAQAYVEGDSLKNYLVAVVVPDQEVLIPWARSQGIKGTFVELCADDRVKAHIQGEIDKLGAHGSRQLKGFEVPKAIHLESELFSVENSLVTPTFKLKRPVVKSKYAETVRSLYASIRDSA